MELEIGVVVEVYETREEFLCRLNFCTEDSLHIGCHVVVS